MRTASLLLVTLLFLISAGNTSAAIISTATYNGHTYHLLSRDSGQWWTEFEQEAVLLGGHLVTINDAAEDAFVLDTFKQAAIDYKTQNAPTSSLAVSLFIGLEDVGPEYNFQWVSGDTSTYTNWANGEPAVDLAQKYAAINVNHPLFSPGKWHDIFAIPGADYMFAVAEVNSVQATVPEPASVAIWGFGALGCAAVAYRRKRKQAA